MWQGHTFFLIVWRSILRIVDLIRLKREGHALPLSSIEPLFNRYLEEKVPKYQMSALLMAIYFQGMENEELIEWTRAMMCSGKLMNWDHLKGPKVDKHSTGGVGDKISLPLAPLLAACGAYVPMMSGRGLGHTGGTLDKLESIQGFQTQLDESTFENLLQTLKVGMIGQTDEFVPMDRHLYALRDVTGTVPSIPLIASSIMSKKLAEGTESLILDVKVGKGAFMKTREDGRKLAQTCIALGHGMGRNVRALLTQMDQPIGRMIGNALEVKESIELLQGKGPQDSRILVLALAEELLDQCGIDVHRAQDCLDSGDAYTTFVKMVEAQGGDVSMITDPDRLPKAKHRLEIKAPQSGYIQEIDALKIGNASVYLGAGRHVVSDQIDPSVGMQILTKVGQWVDKGDPLVWIEHNERGIEIAQKGVEEAYQFSEEPVDALPLIYERMTHEECTPYKPLT
jgi:pyrimidine-nucleoside phosphorylase